MGVFFKAFLTGFNEGRDRARSESYRRQDKHKIPVKLIEPSAGRIMKLEVTEPNDRVAQMYMDHLTTYAEGMEQFGVQWTVTGKTIQIVFDDGNMAENARQTWRK